ncbi:MAG: SMP-30/gluconolactonase/LRE family protein [Devosia sp.]
MAITFRTLLAGPFAGESPVWDERRGLVFFVDMDAPAVHAIGLDGDGLLTWPMPETCGSIGLCQSGRLIVAQPHALLLLDPDTGTVTPFATIDGELPTSRLNDGKTGPDGAFWVGSMDGRADREPISALYRVTGDGRVERRIAGTITCSNGLAWSADGRTLFHSDSRGPWIDRYGFDPETGALSDRTRIATLDEVSGRPDGGACDSAGTYWSAGVSAGRLNRFLFDGTLIEAQPVAVPAPSMPCFCGPDMRTMVLTSLNLPVHQGHPGRGHVLIGRAPVAGIRVGRLSGL